MSQIPTNTGAHTASEMKRRFGPGTTVFSILRYFGAVSISKAFTSYKHINKISLNGPS